MNEVLQTILHNKIIENLKSRASDYFEPAEEVRTRDIFRESGDIIKAGAQKTASFLGSQYEQTKESLPYLPEAIKETAFKPELAGEFIIRNVSELEKSAVNVLSLINKANPTYGIKPLKTAKQNVNDVLENIKQSLTLPEPTTTTSGIISTGAKLTADFQKYAILDRGIKALFTPLATVFAKYKPETATHLFNDAAMKAEMSGYDEIATQFFKVAKNIPKNPTEQIRLFTRISSQVKDLKFKGQLLGGMKEMARRASGEMAELALKEPAFVKSGMFELVKQLPEAARVFSNIGSLVALGQIDFEEGQGSRANQALLDIAIGAAFEGAGVLVKRLSPSAKKIFEDIQQGVKTPLKSAEELAREIKSSQAGFAKLPGEKSQVFQGYQDLTTKFLNYAKGKTTLFRQEIMDFARRPELKKGEADLLLRKLKEFAPKTDPLAQEATKYNSAEEFVDNFKIGKKGNQYSELNNLSKQEVRPDTFGEPLSGKGDIRSTQSIDEAQVQKYMKQIEQNVSNKRLDLNPPVIIDNYRGFNEIIDGHNRAEAYRRLGYADAPIVTKSQLTDIWNKANKGDKLSAQEFADSIRRIEMGTNKIMELTKEQLKGKSHRDFPQGSILKIGKYRIHIDGLKTYAEHDNNPMIKLKEFDMPEYIRDIVF